MDISGWKENLASYLGEIVLLQDSLVVQLMTGNDVSDRPHAHLVLVGHPAAHPRRLIQSAEQRHCSHPNRGEFFYQPSQAALAEGSILYVVILLEALDRSPVIARNTQRPVGENPLGVDHVAEHFPYAPL